MATRAEQEVETKPKGGILATKDVKTHLLVPLAGSDGPNHVNISLIKYTRSRHPNDMTRPGEIHTEDPQNTKLNN